MSRVTLVVHPHRDRALALARQAADWLLAHGHEVSLPPADAAACGLPDHAADPDRLAGASDVVVSLGGDGTMLRAVALVARHRVPVLGVNLGSLGYLTAVEPDDLVAVLGRVVAGDVRIEERAMLAVATEAGEPVALALNELVVEKSLAGRSVRLAVEINGTLFARYIADGLIVATPTGSTAYAFSARGPILAPGLQAFQLTPVSPHMPFDRTLVLAATDVLRVRVYDLAPALVSVDGHQLAPLPPGEALVCTLAPERALLAAPAERDFYGILKAKFSLAER